MGGGVTVVKRLFLEQGCTLSMYMYICWKLLSNQNFKGPYLEAEMVEEVMGWLG